MADKTQTAFEEFAKEAELKTPTNANDAATAAAEATRIANEAMAETARLAAEAKNKSTNTTDWFEHEEVKAKYGERFKSKAEFFEHIDKPTVVEKIVEKIVDKPIEYASEVAKALDDFKRKGGNEKEFLRVQSTNWDEVSAESIIKEQLKAKYPKATQHQIDLQFKKKYDFKEGLSEEELTNDIKDEVELARLSLESDADEIRATRKAEQIKILDIQPAQPTAAEIEEERKSLEYKNAWDAKAPITVGNFKELKFSIPYKDEAGNEKTYDLTHDVEAEYKESLIDFVKNPKEIFSLFTDENGLLKQEDLFEAAYYAKNKQKIVAGIANKFAGEVKEAFIKENLKNTNFRTAGSRTNATDVAADDKVIADWKKATNYREPA